MDRFLLLIFAFPLILFGGVASAQQTDVIGAILEIDTEQPIPGITISIEGTSVKVLTDEQGKFTFAFQDLPLGEQILAVNSINYESKRFPIIINEGELLDLGEVYLNVDLSEDNRRISTISLSDDELDGDDASSFNISGL